MQCPVFAPTEGDILITAVVDNHQRVVASAIDSSKILKIPSTSRYMADTERPVYHERQTWMHCAKVPADSSDRCGMRNAEGLVTFRSLLMRSPERFILFTRFSRSSLVPAVIFGFVHHSSFLLCNTVLTNTYLFFPYIDRRGRSMRSTPWYAE